jgi:hypothetical protein
MEEARSFPLAGLLRTGRVFDVGAFNTPRSTGTAIAGADGHGCMSGPRREAIGPRRERPAGECRMAAGVWRSA